MMALALQPLATTYPGGALGILGMLLGVILAPVALLTFLTALALRLAAPAKHLERVSGLLKFTGGISTAGLILVLAAASALLFDDGHTGEDRWLVASLGSCHLALLISSGWLLARQPHSLTTDRAKPVNPPSKPNLM